MQLCSELCSYMNHPAPSQVQCFHQGFLDIHRFQDCGFLRLEYNRSKCRQPQLPDRIVSSFQSYYFDINVLAADDPAR